MDEDTDRRKRKNRNVQTKRDEIEYNKKERTKRILRMQRKYSGSHLMGEGK